MSIFRDHVLGKPAEDDLRRPVALSAEVLQQIVATIGHRPPESGGLLGGNRAKQQIVRYLFDHSASTTGAAYSPNTEVINSTLEKWDAECGDKIIGFIHSHPVGYAHPSGGDEEYAERILRAIPAMKRIFLPIAVFKRNGDPAHCDFVIHPFVAYLDLRQRVVVEPVLLDLTDEQGKSVERVESWSTSVPSPFEKTKRPYEDETFSRVRLAYDLDLLRASRAVVAGVGGSSELVECLARAGVGQFVLIDHDVISLTNLATQQTYRKDVGRPKVNVLAERLADINPAAEIVSIRKRLEDLSDREMAELLKGPLGRSKAGTRNTLLCGFTDSFPAQMRINRLALQFATPSLCAQVYKEGRGAEVTFTHPSITPACHRCALASRYRAYEEGNVKNIGSEGSTIFSTVRINAISGFVALALLHADGKHPRWGRLLERVSTRNLVLVRMDPEFRQLVGLDVFERTFGDSNSRICFDETIWTAVTPDNGENGNAFCPDCGGVGYLESLEGTFLDTRTGARSDGYHDAAKSSFGSVADNGAPEPPPLPDRQGVPPIRDFQGGVSGVGRVFSYKA